MANIKVEVSHGILDGQPVTFVAPCDCTKITGLKVYYPDGSKVFSFKDAHGNTLTGLGNLFAAGAYVKAILDVKNGFAYIQNADTNTYIEATFLKKGKDGDLMNGLLKFQPENGTSVVTSEVYRNVPYDAPTASYMTRNVITNDGGATMQLFKGEVGAELSTSNPVNHLKLTETDTQLKQPLTVASGGTGRNSFTAGSYLVGNGKNGLVVKTPEAVLKSI